MFIILHLSKTVNKVVNFCSSGVLISYNILAKTTKPHLTDENDNEAYSSINM